LSHAVADLVEKLLNQEKELSESSFSSEELRAYNYYTQQGCFRYLIIRYCFSFYLIPSESSRTKQFVVKLVCKITDIDFKKKLIDFFKAKESKFGELGFACNGLLIETHNEPSLYVPNNRELTDIVFGKDSIEEKLLSNTFQVPINSFFQVHTDLAEMLYQKVKFIKMFFFNLNLTKFIKKSC
jgi:tRNA/tmRNA/rRNA uracil-C5-methylase (TrmA/RlmC/RlmD family)